MFAEPGLCRPNRTVDRGVDGLTIESGADCLVTPRKPVSVLVGRLIEFVTILGQDVQGMLTPAAWRGVGNMSVVVRAA